VIAAAAYVLRRHLPETEYSAHTETEQQQEAPLRQAIREQPWLLLAALLFASGYGIVNYVTMVLLPTYAHEFGHVTEHEALRINTAGQALALFAVPFFGWLSDRVWTRRGMLAAAFSAEAIVSWQAFRLVQSRGSEGLWLVQLSFALLLAIVMGTEPATLSQQFPARYRVSAYAVVFNIGIGIAGGTAPMTAVGLIKVSSNTMAPAIYLIFAAVLAVIGALALRGEEDRIN
jgi:MHS family proline/betaine transporter-like MFS transporter